MRGEGIFKGQRGYNRLNILGRMSRDHPKYGGIRVPPMQVSVSLLVNSERGGGVNQYCYFFTNLTTFKIHHQIHITTRIHKTQF